MKKLIVLSLFIIGLLLVGTSTNINAETGVRYNTFTLSNNRLVLTQTAYIPIKNINEFHGVSLGEPNDIHIDKNNVIYIVTRHAGVGKLIIFDMALDAVTVLGEDYLVNPNGVFVNDVGEIYIADRASNIAYRLAPDGEILQTFTRPDSPLFGNEQFQPRKIVSDARGNVFILNLGTRGLAQFSRNGEFLGYFGTNTITPTLRTVLQYTFFTEEQRSRLFNLSPPEIANVAIDNRGLIHTVSLGIENHGIKRLNISGDNLLPAMYNAPDLVDVYVGPIGNIYAIDRSGFIYEYDIEGNLLFVFGGQDISNQVQGLFNTPSALAVDSHFNIYVLDRASGELKIFLPTEFTNYIHTALATYQEGFYVQSQAPWEQVLKMNDFFDLAHRGLGNAYYSLGLYHEALEEYYIAHDRAGYSDAYWEVRNLWLLDNVGMILIAFFGVLLLYLVNLKLRFMHVIGDPLKKGIRFLRRKSRLFDDILFMFSYLRNPADATYYIKRENRVSVFSATVLLGIYFMFYIHYIYNLGFLFNQRLVEDINLMEELIKVILPIVIWVVSNALIASIREGEGRLRDVYITTVFSLAPFFLVLPLITGMSNVLTYNEAFLISFLQTVSMGVTILYFFFMVKETHFYTVRETFSSILISAFAMVMMMLSVFIVYILLSELGILMRDVVMEVYYRVADR